MAAILRFRGLDWDGGIGAHPDERFIVGVAESLHWPDRLNPFDIAPSFAYGHLPLYLLALAGQLVRTGDLLLVGRALAALFDIGAVVLTFTLGYQVYGRRVGLLGAAFVASMVSHVQQAHFYIADVPLVFFVLGALLFAVRLVRSGQPLDAWLAGVWAGLAVGTKLSGALLVLPLGTACAASSEQSGRRWRYGLECCAAAVIAFALTNPLVLPSFSTFWRNVAEQMAIARGVLDVPYTRQFHGTLPYLYPIGQQLHWGMGWPLGLAIFGGSAWAIWQAARESSTRAEWVLLTWVVPGFTLVGALHAKFPRYMLSLTPLLALYAAHFLTVLRSRIGRPASFLICFCLAWSLLCCIAFVSLYRTPHPWQAASGWFYDYVPRGTVVAVEQWDHPLPLDAAGYHLRELPIFDDDTQEKWTAMEESLAEASYMVISSKRGYATLAQWSERYPLTAHYYSQLFAGRVGGAGYEPVACFGRHPRLGPLLLVDSPTADLDFSLPELCWPEGRVIVRLGRLDESFVVYDHPQVMIWRRAP